MPPSLQGKPAGISLQAAHDLLVEMESGMTQGWQAAKAKVSASFGALGRELVARETAVRLLADWEGVLWTMGMVLLAAA